jgi:hypothetical protein
MGGRSSGTLPTRVQILVLALFSKFSRIYRRHALSGKRRFRDDEASMVTLEISRSAGAQSFRGAHRGRVCVRVVNVCIVLCDSNKIYSYCYFRLLVL